MNGLCIYKIRRPFFVLGDTFIFYDLKEFCVLAALHVVSDMTTLSAFSETG
jgi:hypothetical protein